METRTMKDGINAANPSTIADMFRVIQLGDVLRGQIPQVVRNITPAPRPGLDPALPGCGLPHHARAAVMLSAYARGGFTSSGPLSTGQLTVAPNGDLACQVVDAFTGLDVIYIPQRGDVVSITSAVAADVLTLPKTLTTVLLLDATVDNGTALGSKIITVPGATPAAGRAALDTAKTMVKFAPGEATRATVTLLVASAADLTTLLDSPQTF